MSCDFTGTVEGSDTIQTALLGARQCMQLMMRIIRTRIFFPRKDERASSTMMERQRTRHEGRRH